MIEYLNSAPMVHPIPLFGKVALTGLPRIWLLAVFGLRLTAFAIPHFPCITKRSYQQGIAYREQHRRVTGIDVTQRCWTVNIRALGCPLRGHSRSP